MPLRSVALLTASLAALSLLAGSSALAQDTVSQRGVRIGLTYQPGSRPGVVVLPVAGAAGDSLQTIVARDLDYSDRVTVIGAAGAEATALRGAGTGPVNFALWKRLGAAAVVRLQPSATGMTVNVYDVGTGRAVYSDSSALPEPALGAEWRMAVHRTSDDLVRALTGAQGIAATRVLYVRGGRVYVTDSDGWGDRPVGSDGPALSPTWGPGGGRVAYSVLGDAGSRIVVRDLRTGAARTVGAPRGLNITPAFSPTGSMLVFAHGQENGTDLMATDASGTGPLRRLTVGRGSDNVSPSFSPDGRRIAFTSGRVGHPEVYLMDADGSNVELLTPFNYGEQNYRSNPAWSPDGRLIAYQAQIGGTFQVLTISLRDRAVRQLTSEGRNEDPSWAPDGRHLVFTSTRTGVQQLFVLDTETGRARQLTTAPGARLASWSPVLGALPGQ